VGTVINYPSSPRLGERRPGGEGLALICPEYTTTTTTAFRDQPKRSACPCFPLSLKGRHMCACDGV
ncbi:MAG: hypothetical protein ACK53L_28615, partial [Pirellulaceae bacterium]